MKNKKLPMRRCVGCMESKPKNTMVRVAWYEGELTVDPTGKAKGRGVYICPNEECIAKAKKRNALQRSFDGEISCEDIDRVFQELLQNEPKGE
jgi:hypothetical protein